MRYSKSLKEVWDWKDTIYKERKRLSLKEYLKLTTDNAEKFYKRHDIKLKKAS